MSKYKIYEFYFKANLYVNYVKYHFWSGKPKNNTRKTERKEVRFPVRLRVLEELEVNLVKSALDSLSLNEWEILIKKEIGYYDWGSDKSFDIDEPYVITFSQIEAKEIDFNKHNLNHWKKELNAKDYINILEQESLDSKEKLRDK